MEKVALITGATSGIGKAIAIKLAENNYNLIITGRRNDRLEKLKIEIENNTKSSVLTLNFDIRIKPEVQSAVNQIPEEWKNNLKILVNNAGLASGLEPLQKGDSEDWEKMIDTNIKGLLYITKEISPILVKNKKGHIINIGSIAGKEVYPNGNVYCATKHAVDALTKAMRIDLLPYNIKVTQIAPGMVNTEFSTVRFHGDTNKADNVYKGLTPLFAKDIAEILFFIVTRPEHVCINDIIVTPTAQANGSIVNRINE
ncbi:MAG: SDR family NAD(P)-dependent oxidoreductase [Bacteroidales bacterium]|jgi:NADP-dependent 3-hydroxy acid dehydrogenase YdfG|nr:SDR family NAD(P)-dependent oxidoreductase [Bacteroidales bacterium]